MPAVERAVVPKPLVPVSVGRRDSVVHVLAPMREGGLERVVAMLAGAQQAAGREVCIISVLSPDEPRPHPFLEALDSQGTTSEVVTLGNRAYVAEWARIRAIVRRFGAGVVHTHGYRADVIAGAAARREGAAVVSTVHGYTGGSVRNRLNERMQGYGLRRAQAAVAVSEPLRARLLAMGVRPECVHVVPNGFARAGTLLPRQEARRRLGLEEDGFLVGFVGRLSAEKGPDVALDALTHAEGWRLAFIGEGPLRDSLTQRAAQAGIAERVSFVGLVPGAASYLRAFDAVLLSSRTEGTPITLLEAMAAEVPVVAAAVGGIPHVVSSEEATLVPAARPDAIAAAVCAVRDLPEAAATRAAAARTRLDRAHGVDAWLAAYDTVYAAAARRVATR